MSERFGNISSVIAELQKRNILKNNDTQLNIYFDDWVESKNFSSWSIQPIDFEIVDSNKVVRHLLFEDFHDTFPLMEWLNIGKQCNKEMKALPMQKQMFKLMVLVKLKDTGRYKFHPLKLYNGDIDQKNYSRLTAERSQARINHCAKTAEKCSLEESEDEFFEL